MHPGYFRLASHFSAGTVKSAKQHSETVDLNKDLTNGGHCSSDVHVHRDDQGRFLYKLDVEYIKYNYTKWIFSWSPVKGTKFI